MNVNQIEIVNQERSLCAQIFVTCFFPVFIGMAIFMACFVGGVPFYHLYRYSLYLTPFMQRTGNIAFIIIPSLMVFFSLFGFIVVLRKFYRGVEHAVVDMSTAQMHVVHHGYLCSAFSFASLLPLSLRHSLEAIDLFIVNPHWEETINLRDCKSYSVRAQQMKRGTYWYLDLHMNNGESLDFGIGESTNMIVEGTMEKIKVAMARCGVNDGAIHTSMNPIVQFY